LLLGQAQQFLIVVAQLVEPLADLPENQAARQDGRSRHDDAEADGADVLDLPHQER
jgi:hypothetical protein